MKFIIKCEKCGVVSDDANNSLFNDEFTAETWAAKHENNLHGGELLCIIERKAD
jgi:hypothetical protein